jgi:ABC-2 type transport system permease protein
MLAAFTRPFLWLILVGYGLGGAVRGMAGVDYRHYVFGGAIILTVMQSGISNGATSALERDIGSLRDALVAPIPRAVVALGRVGGGALVALFNGLATLVFAPLVQVSVSPRLVCLVVAVSVPWAIACSSLGMVLALGIPQMEKPGTITGLVVVPLYFLSGGFYPTDRLPDWMTALVRLNPTTYAVDLARHAVASGASFSAPMDVFIVVGFALAMCTLSTIRFNME